MKSELRKQYKALRKNISHEEKILLDDKIYNNVISSSFYKYNSVILAYVSFGDEASTDKIILKSLSDNKKVFAPKCRDKFGNMDFYRIYSLNDLKEGLYGIREPEENIDRIYKKGYGGLCFVPGLSFSHDGYRLGYGKGYYDRFIQQMNDAFYIGICYEMQISENLIHDEFDRKVNAVVTENSLWRCSAV